MPLLKKDEGDSPKVEVKASPNFMPKQEAPKPKKKAAAKKPKTEE